MGAEPGDRVAGAAVAVLDEVDVVGVGEEQPEEVPLLGRDLLEVAVQEPVRRVEREDVVAPRERDRRERVELVEEELVAGSQRRAAPRLGLEVDGRAQGEEVGALALVEPQGAGDGVEHLEPTR